MSEPQTPRETLKALGEPFPKTALKSRQGGGGKSFTYVETHTVINRLNSATSGEWSFHVTNVEWRADLLIVQGELTIPGLGTRTGFGVQKVAPNAGEDLVKGGASDALKKAATLFGVALELYGPDYEADTSQPQPAPRSAPQNGAQHDPVTPPPSRTNELLATERQRNLIDVLARELNINGADLDARCVERCGVPVAEISRTDASTLIESLKETQAKRQGQPA